MSDISIENLATEIEGVLENYNKTIVSGVKSETKKAMKQLVKGTKQDAPLGKRNQHYKDSITSKKVVETDDGIVLRWYVKGSDYRLSHLLEKGHATRNGGRTRAYRFISKNLDKVKNNYERGIEEVIRNG